MQQYNVSSSRKRLKYDLNLLRVSQKFEGNSYHHFVHVTSTYIFRFSGGYQLSVSRHTWNCQRSAGVLGILADIQHHGSQSFWREILQVC